MSWKDIICRTPVVIACCIIAGILIVWKLERTKSREDAGMVENTLSMEGSLPIHHRRNRWGEEEPNIADIPVRDAVWQNVDGSNYVYAAYYEERARWPYAIRIIGATRSDEREIFRCKLWYSNKTSVEGNAKVQKFQGHRMFKYSACFILCPLTTEEIPESVSVITLQKRLRNRLLVVNTKKYDRTTKNRIRHRFPTKQSSKEIGICVKPLQNTYNNSVQLVEFMELNRILGVDHVAFYKTSISLTTECILRNYIDEGRVTLATAMPWKNDPKTLAEIKNENDLAALNDCLYRNMHNFSYLAFLELDQFVMPAKNNTVQELIETLENKFNDVPFEIASFSFRNGLFYLEWPDDFINEKSQDAFARSLTTLRKTLRKFNTEPQGVRSKYIVKPTKVLEVGDEKVSEFVRGFGSFQVYEDEGILNHYRFCEYGGSKCTNERSRADRTVFRYKDRLVEAVKLRWQTLQKRCGIGDIQQARSDMKRPETTKWTPNTTFKDKTAVAEFTTRRPRIVEY